MIHQAKVTSKSMIIGPTYQFGVRGPRNAKEALELDTKNTNSKWQDAMKSEIGLIQDFQTFEDKGEVTIFQTTS